MFVNIPSVNCVTERTSTKIVYDSLRPSRIVVTSQKNLFRKHNGQLIIKTNASIPVILKDIQNNSDETQDKKYIYLGFMPAVNRYVVQVMYYERSEFLLISKNGDKTVVWNIPYQSTNNKYFISLSKGLEYSINPNGLQIFKLEGDKLVKNCEIIIKQHEPEEIKWKNKMSFVLKSHAVNGDGLPVRSYKFTEFLLR